MDILKRPLNEVYHWGQPLAHIKAPKVAVDILPDLVDKDRFIGIEVEVENIRVAPEAISHELWNIKEDGSLRNHGIEYVSAPLKGNSIRYAINNFYEHLPKDADFSPRTSIHVHINVRDLLVGDVFNIIVLYIVFEKLLYAFAGPRRYKNIFCVPIQETRLPHSLADFLADGSFPGLLKDWQKYSGMNLVPVRGFGTIEFRQMEGHRDPVRLMHWINILLRMFKAARATEFSDLYNMVQRLNSTSFYEAFLRNVFGPEADHLMGPDLQLAMEHGVSVIKSVQLPSPFLKQLLNDMSNDSDLLLALGISNKYKISATNKKDMVELNLADHLRGLQLRMNEMVAAGLVIPEQDLEPLEPFDEPREDQ